MWASEDEGGSQFGSEMAEYVGQRERHLGFNHRSRQNQLLFVGLSGCRRSHSEPVRETVGEPMWGCWLQWSSWGTNSVTWRICLSLYQPAVSSVSSAGPKSVLDPFTSFSLESPVLYRLRVSRAQWWDSAILAGGSCLACLGWALDMTWGDTQKSPEEFLHTLAACPSQSAQSHYSVQGLT